MKITFLSFVLLFSSAFLTLSAQVKYDGSFDEDIVVSGTSTLHDWDMTTRGAESTATFTMDENGVITGISDIQFKMKAKNLKSGKGGMDKNAYKALKVSDHPYITASSKSAKISTIEGEIYTVKTTLNLTMAGTTKPVDMSVFVSMKNDGVINVRGEKEINMKDFDIDPPSFMLGTVKTGEKVTLKFNINYKKQ